MTRATYWGRMDDRSVDLPSASWTTPIAIGAAVLSLHELARRAATLHSDQREAIEIAIGVYRRARQGGTGLQ